MARPRAGIEAVAVGARAKTSGAVGTVSAPLVGLAQDLVQDSASEIIEKVPSGAVKRALSMAFVGIPSRTHSVPGLRASGQPCSRSDGGSRPHGLGKDLLPADGVRSSAQVAPYRASGGRGATGERGSGGKVTSTGRHGSAAQLRGGVATGASRQQTANDLSARRSSRLKNEDGAQTTEHHRSKTGRRAEAGVKF